MSHRTSQKGFSLIEVVVSASVLSVFIVSIVVVFQTLLVYSSTTIKHTQASFLAEEGLEAVKSMRDQDWDTHIASLSSGTTYYLQYGSVWTSTQTPQYVDSFLRSFTIENVSRDGGGSIVDSGGTNDPNTKKVTATVEWFYKNATSTRTLSTYITNLHAN
jgi:prepilin-type N-terminal cleavage/methylation domain-containing protein